MDSFLERFGRHRLSAGLASLIRIQQKETLCPERAGEIASQIAGTLVISLAGIVERGILGWVDRSANRL